MSRDFMERAREEMTRRELEISKSRPIDDEVRSEIADALMMDLIGPDKPGQAHGYGTGVTKSKVTKLSLDLRRSRKESLVNQNRLLLEKLDSQELYLTGAASKDMFFQDTSDRRRTVQNQQVSQSSQGQATRQQQSLDSMGEQVNATNMQQNPLTGHQYGYSDMQQDMQQHD
ncbi:hypothetical protein Tco_0304421 [Tanacetum coccineum]